MWGAIIIIDLLLFNIIYYSLSYSLTLLLFRLSHLDGSDLPPPPGAGS